jgi:hypothetical protein
MITDIFFSFQDENSLNINGLICSRSASSFSSIIHITQKKISAILLYYYYFILYVFEALTAQSCSEPFYSRYLPRAPPPKKKKYLDEIEVNKKTIFATLMIV